LICGDYVHDMQYLIPVPVVTNQVWKASVLKYILGFL